MNGRALALVLLVSACFRAATDHERLGDAAYAKGSYADALAEYRAGVKAGPTANLEGKLALAALHVPALRESADAFQRLALLDHTRTDEAATGLVLVAREAERTADTVALRLSLGGLRTLAPDRASGRVALSLIRAGKLDPVEVVALMPAALASARDGGSVDTLLLAYGAALRTTTNCEEGAAVFRTAVRRVQDNGARNRAVNGLVGCALQLGEEALSLKKNDPAAQWFESAAALDSTSPSGRRALLGLGEAREAGGDLVAAAIAYQRVIGADSVADSLGLAARARLAAIGSAQPADTTVAPKP
ncbi:MAG TPA: tetratricopeptide repeat protein [Gemmatimonadales bacterium]|nr:tetratricopeptide repeat protein [Gemmatimonadales bacterium]